MRPSLKVDIKKKNDMSVVNRTHPKGGGNLGGVGETLNSRYAPGGQDPRRRLRILALCQLLNPVTTVSQKKRMLGLMAQT